MGQVENAEPRAELLRVRNDTVVPVRIDAGTTPVVVPTCNAAESQDPELCILAVELEVKSTSGWARAQLDPTICCLPGGHPIEKGPVRIVQPGTAVGFTYTFARDDYLLKRGQQVRLRIHTWPTEESMRAGGPEHDLITAPFKVY